MLLNFCVNQPIKLAVRSNRIIRVVRLFITIVTIFDIKVFTVCVSVLCNIHTELILKKDKNKTKSCPKDVSHIVIRISESKQMRLNNVSIHNKIVLLKLYSKQIKR